ncbi:MAG: hypothetical protein JNN32_06900 [Flavobacteriales bacterium]|nr:hypothetical protein [Flavobacteriales bacterium]
MTNFKQPIILWTLLTFTVACKKEAPEQYPVDGLYSHTLPTGGVAADSSTVVEMSVTLKEEDFANDRIVHFTTTSGRWLSPGASAAAPLELVVAADEAGTAVVRWIPGRTPGPVSFTTWVSSAQYSSQSNIITTEAYPDTLALHTNAAVFDSTDHIMTLSVHLYRSTGYHSTGLPLSFRAWHRVDGEDVPVGNFTTAPLLLTNRSNDYEATLDLFSPGLSDPDTIYVQTLCGTKQSNVVQVVFLQP